LTSLQRDLIQAFRHPAVSLLFIDSTLKLGHHLNLLELPPRVTSEDLTPLLQVSENSFGTHFAFCLPNQEHLVVLDTVQWPNLSRPFRFLLTLQVVAASWHVPPIVRSACSSQTQARV